MQGPITVQLHSMRAGNSAMMHMFFHQQPGQARYTQALDCLSPDPSCNEDMERSKRSAESGQTVDTFAVCSKCNRLSYNLKQCDKCGNPLSEDNASMCVSAEPKRARVDPPASGTNGTLVNGSSIGHGSSGDNHSSSPSSALPVPQALYKNINQTGGDSNSVRPQALYMNVNFRTDSPTTAVPNSDPITTTARSNSNTLFNSSSNNIPSNSSPVAVGSPITSDPQNLVSHRTPTLTSGPPPLVSTTMNSTDPATSGFGSFNLPQPPPYSATSVSVPEQEESVGELIFSQSDTNIALPAMQIRIGTRKFFPASSVTFKEDGVLFALKDYTHAPVLLNARAIVKCEANMDAFPAFFVYLEATCIRQIRNIFNLTTDEFMENSPACIKKCITIFPNVTPAVQKELRGRIANGVRKIFHSMSGRYPRPTPYLQEISNSTVIDLLFQTMRLSRPATTSDVIPRGLSPSRPTVTTAIANNIQHHMATNQNSLIYQQRAAMNPRLPPPAPTLYTGDVGGRMPQQGMMQLQIPARDGGITRISQRAIGPRQVLRPATSIRQTTTTVTTQATTQNKPTSASTAGTTAPLLVVPSDQAKWASMQKDLVEGGVYHVELPTKERKYFLWDGARLVPCLVQNTEVQLNCIYARIGSLRCDAKDVKVRAENPSAFMFTIKSDKTGTVPMSLGFELIANCVIYSDTGDKTIIFVNLTHQGWWNVQNQLKLAGDVDPCYNPTSLEARRKHIIMIFKNINVEQRDALLGIKNKSNGQPVFSPGHLNIVLKVLSEIYNNIPSTYFQGNSKVFTTNLESAIKEFMAVDAKGQVIDDDDDDVIMTSEEVGIKCPYTQQVMKEPVKNKICQHNYERVAIQEFIVRKKGNARCPYAGCGNSKPLSMLDLEDNLDLKKYIKKHVT